MPPSLPVASVLIVDDEPPVGTVLQALLRQDGLHARHVLSGTQCLEALAHQAFDLVITDLRMDGMDGMTLLQRIRAQWPDLPVVMMSAHGTVHIAVEAMKNGATDFVTKPFDREEILYTLRKALASTAAVAAAPPAPPREGAFVGASPAMADVMALIQRAAQSTATVLVRGESGTGKELAARAIHDASPRRAGPFVPLHCGALPDTLLESELFGYEKGAFTGATTRKPGRVELAHGGTLFLDEIGDISSATQVKLLRVLQERSFERVGGTQTLRVDVRFVAATHRDLEALVAAKEFREDLFYRLNVIPLWMPPLRARPDDVEALARHFCAVHAGQDNRPGATLDDGALEALRAHPWPGNVRELQNFVERLVVLAPSPRITRADVEREFARRPAFETQRPPPLTPTPAPVSSVAPPPLGRSLDERRREAEREALVHALQKANNNRTLAARLLGVSRRTLYNKLEEYGMA